MKGMFVNSDGTVDYADAIVSGIKDIETRNRDMLRELVGERVAVVKTGRGKTPTIVGYVFVRLNVFLDPAHFSEYRGRTLIPEGSKFDCNNKGKWCYFLANAERCRPHSLPENAVRHGRSWCEFEEAGALALVCEVFTIEICPNCGHEEVIWAKGVTRCPDCGASIAPCSMCDVCSFATCPYGCDGSDNDLKKPITMPDVSSGIADKLYQYL